MRKATDPSFHGPQETRRLSKPRSGGSTSGEITTRVDGANGPERRHSRALAGGGHSHRHGIKPGADSKRLAFALALIVAFMCGEVVVGILAHSLALLSDAGHMVTDAAAIGLSILALRLAARPAAATTPMASTGPRSSLHKPTAQRCSCSPS